MKRHFKKLIIISILVIVAGGITSAFLYFLPRYVTESVKVVTADQTGCMVETSDKFILKISPCDGRPGETITTTYDEKIKERFYATTPP